MASNTSIIVSQIAVATDGYTEHDVSVFSDTVANADTWEEIDLSAQIGAVSALVILQVTMDQKKWVSFQPSGEGCQTGDLWRWGSSNIRPYGTGYVSEVIVPTNPAGKIDILCEFTGANIDVILLASFEQNAAPVVTGVLPTGTTTSSAPITFTTTDDTQVTEATIDCALTDPSAAVHHAIINGAWQVGYSGTIAANGSNGFDVAITTHPAMAAGVWSAYAYAEDALAASGNDTWGWTVSAGPTVVGTAPVPLSVIGSTGAVISWTTADDSAVGAATLDLEITNPTGTSDAVLGGVAQAGWSFAKTANASNGYDCTATPDAAMERGAWSATASADDDLGTSGTDTWTWTIAVSPSVISMHPEGVVPSVDEIRFQIADDAAFGLMPATLSISAIVSAGGQNTLWPAVVLGVVQDGWDVTVTYPGATPVLMDVTIRAWPMDLAATHRRSEIVVDITSTSGLSL